MSGMIVGLCGAAGSGKSTMAKRLVDKHGFTCLSFATPMKRMLEVILESDYWLIDSARKQQSCGVLMGVTPRHAMQTLATEWGRNCIHPDLWVMLAQRAAAKVDGPVVFDDVRFPNEAAMIREAGGKVVLVSGRGGIEGRHISEAGISDPDMTCHNEASIEMLHGWVDYVLGPCG